MYTQKALFHEEQLIQAIQVQFDRQRDTIVSNLAVVQRGKGMTTRDYVTELIDWEQADAELKMAIAPGLIDVIIEAGLDAIALLGVTDSAFDPYSEAVQKYHEARTTKIAADVNDETEKQLRATLTEGINAGETTYELAARVQTVMGIASTTRADTITRTEVARAQSAADIFAWDQSGVVEAKEWFTAKSERTCAFCADMHGKIIGLEENYFDKGDVQVVETTNRKGEKIKQVMHHDYDDVAGPPSHPRCRCSLLPVRTQA
jgi:SPP1 gp7 family putative phage head morphogenesis protein